ncbi:DUF317 domain-containing protein [Embleya sp. NPDC020630]|uniref:DUF317 domain-containing protein n=1 Tax=Embleya sp. NPDC020630 TaxID=3363979 RepID=UPI003796EC34
MPDPSTMPPRGRRMIRLALGVDVTALTVPPGTGTGTVTGGLGPAALIAEIVRTAENLDFHIAAERRRRSDIARAEATGARRRCDAHGYSRAGRDALDAGDAAFHRENATQRLRRLLAAYRHATATATDPTAGVADVDGPSRPGAEAPIPTCACARPGRTIPPHRKDNTVNSHAHAHLDDPDSRVTVKPYLAGIGEDTVGPIARLLESRGWTMTDDACCNTTWFSPDGLAHIRFQPEDGDYHRDGNLWRITVGDGAFGLVWQTTFPDTVPYELIKAFVLAMNHPAGLERHPRELPRRALASVWDPRPLGEEHLHTDARAHLDDPDSRIAVKPYLAGIGEDTVGPIARRLQDAGWTVTDDACCNTTWFSPDGLARVRFQPEDRDYHRNGNLWVITVGDGTFEPAWRVTFPDAVPHELIGAFVRAMIDPAGLVRHPYELPDRHHAVHPART